MLDICCLNGRILPLSEARIDPLDRGFVFGDALYETLKVSHGIVLHLEPHLERLAAGLQRVQIPWPGDLRAACTRVLQASGLGEGSLYLQVTRGAGPRQHFPPRDLVPTWILVPSAHGFDPPASRSLRAVTAPDWRWRHCDVKTTSLMGTVLGKLAARDGGVDEVIFVSEEGELREGGSTNFWVRRGGAFETSPLDGHLLPGVTRQLLLELARRDDLPVVERAPRLDERDEWQEACLSGTLTGVQGVVELDGRPVADGTVGSATRHLATLLASYEEHLVMNRGPLASICPPDA